MKSLAPLSTKEYNNIEIGYRRYRFMSNKYYKYLPWLILGAIGSDQSATYYARTAFDVFYLTTIFLIIYIALLFLHENYLKYRYKDFFTHMLSNSKKDGHL